MIVWRIGFDNYSLFKRQIPKKKKKKKILAYIGIKNSMKLGQSMGFCGLMVMRE